MGASVHELIVLLIFCLKGLMTKTKERTGTIALTYCFSFVTGG